MAAPKISTENPSYFQMISEAITSLKDHEGSSKQAIFKFIQDKYSSQLPQNFNKQLLSSELNKLVESQKLVKLKNSYKISGALAVAVESQKLVKLKNSYKISGALAVAVEETDDSSNKKKVKTKRLSQVKTPDALKKKSTVKEATTDGKEARKTKRLSSIKTPDALKLKKNKAITVAAKRKASSKP